MNQYDHLKNKLHDYKVAIDKDKLWKNTSHAIPQRKRRLAIPVILFAALAISAWLMYSLSLLPVSGPPLASTIFPGNEKSEFTENLNDRTVSNSTETKESKADPIKILSSKLTRSVSKLISPKNQFRAEYSSSSPIQSGNKILNDSEHANEFLKTSAHTERRNEIDDSIKEASITSKENAAASIDPDAVTFILSELKDQDAFIQHNENEVRNTDRIINGQVDYLRNDISQIPLQPNAVAHTSSHKPNIQPQKDQLLQSFQMVQGVGFSTMKIHSLTPESGTYVAQLQQKTRPLEILTTSTTASFNIPGKFTLEPGLQFTRLTTVNDHAWETNERIHKEGITSIIIDEQGIPQSITGNTDVTRTTHYQTRRFTEHKHIDLTIAVHKMLWQKQRLSLHAFLKGAYNISYQAKGTILTANNQLARFSSNNNPYTLNSPFKISGGLHLDYRLSPRWNLTTLMVIDQSGYDLIQENQSIRFEHTGFSLGLGVGYVF